MDGLKQFINEGRLLHGLTKLDESVVNESAINEGDAVKLSKKRTDLEEVKDFLSSGTWSKMLGDYVFGKFDKKKVEEIINQRLSNPQKRAGNNPMVSFIKIFSRELGLDAKKYIGKEIIEDVEFTKDLIDVLEYWSKEASKVNESEELNEGKAEFKGLFYKTKKQADKKEDPNETQRIEAKDLKDAEKIAKDYADDSTYGHFVVVNEKLDASDLADLKSTTGLTKEEKSDFKLMDSMMDKLEGFQKVIEKHQAKAKTEDGTHQLDEIVWANNRESIWQLSDYVNEQIDKINMGLNESYELIEDDVINERELSPLQKEYQEYFKDTLAEFDVDSPAKLSAEKKLEFFKAIKAGWVVGKGKKSN